MLKDNKKSLPIILIVMFSAFMVAFIDRNITATYFTKSLIKIILFLVLPLVYLYKNKADAVWIKKLFIPNKRDIIHSFFLGIICYSIIIIAYYLFRSRVDFTVIRNSLTELMGVNKENFIVISLYIAFVNSMLEEFFFRGFAFIVLKGKWNFTFAFVFSALSFSLYHMGMMENWFSPLIYLFVLGSLFLCGCIFNYMNYKRNNIYTSWLTHMFANFAINSIGFFVFEII